MYQSDTTTMIHERLDNVKFKLLTKFILMHEVKQSSAI